MCPGVRRDDAGRKPPTPVVPAKAGTQYAGKVVIEPRSRGVLGRPVEPGDDSGMRGVLFICSPSLPWRDDLDLVAALDRRLRPLALRQHVVVQRDRKMRAFIFELAQQRIDARCVDLPGLAVDDHTHRITSLSITPRLI